MPATADPMKRVLTVLTVLSVLTVRPGEAQIRASELALVAQTIDDTRLTNAWHPG